MNRDEAKEILLIYRPGTSDANDPQIDQALTLARNDAELGAWLQEHCARQQALREKFRQLAVPDGLLQQIISEHAAANRAGFLKKNRVLLALAGAAVLLLGAFFYWQQQPGEDAKLADYQKQMALMMSTGYSMDLVTNNDSSIRDFLKQNSAPADYVLSEPLQRTPLAGCAVETWQDHKVTLVCFHTDSTTSASTSDMWLFVVKKKLVRNVPPGDEPQFSQINRLAIATWTDGDKLYVLGRMGNTAEIKKYL